MARSNAVWGIDVGNCSLKAMRCFIDDSNPEMLVVDAVDYIEYPQILTQPGVDPDNEIKEAFKLFLSRNRIKGDKVAISVVDRTVWSALSNCRRSNPKNFPISSSMKPSSRSRF